MLFRNDGKGESNVIQNQFTAYLVSALRRKKRDVLQVWMRVSENEFSVDFQDYLLDTPNEPSSPDPIQEITSETYHKIDFENTALEQEIRNLSDLDRFVFLARVLDDRDFEELAKELGTSCSAVIARYYRIIRRIRKALEGGD